MKMGPLEKQTPRTRGSTPVPSMPCRDLREYLQALLIRRCKSNSSYSLRSLARSLEIEPSELSKILNGKRRITLRMFENLSKRLALTPDEHKTLRPKSPLKRKSIHRNLEFNPSPIIPDYQQLSVDSYQVIAEWYHYAILELTHIDGFRSNSGWVARKLGISLAEAKVAVERLCRLELLKISNDGSWQDQSGSITTLGNPFTATALRKLQKAILEKAIVALEETPIEQRDQTSMTVAIDSRLVPIAKQKITKFRRELSHFLQTGTKKDHVYHLGISLYPVTKLTQKKEKS
jgi:uncharacterized protein (TIGR02147 family)